MKLTTSFDPNEKGEPMKATTTEVKRVNMNIPRDLHDAFKATTAARGENMTDVILKYIEDYVKKHGVQPKKGRR